jgi:alkanesulfonate monooxygenase SsuD/methylene tetrahydromethanopterin reductase-like flavin-dependent oxidoreductase (luciferase family)
VDSCPSSGTCKNRSKPAPDFGRKRQVISADDRAFAEAKRFLDSYYSVDYRKDMLKLWVAAGSPAQCVQSLQGYVEAGATTILLRVAGYDQERQFKRVTEEILPAFS